MKNKYTITVDDVCGSTSIDITDGECGNYLDAFISIFLDDEVTSSPFKTVEEAKLFAEFIVMMLRCMNND